MTVLASITDPLVEAAVDVVDAMGLACCSFGQWDIGNEEVDMAELTNEARARFLRLTFSEDRVIGANVVGQDLQLGMLRGLIQSQTALSSWKETLLTDPSRFAEAFVACAHGSPRSS